MSQLDRDVRDALASAKADDLGHPQRQFYREPEPLRTEYSWGALGFLKPATPWHLAGVGLVLLIVGRLFLRAAYGDPLVLAGAVLIVVALLSAIVLKPSPPKRWRGRLITLDDSWRARTYRRLYRR
jgi:hypothetical protein